MKTQKNRRAGVLFYLDPADRLKLKTLAAIHGIDYAGVVTRLVRAESAKHKPIFDLIARANRG